MYYSENLFGIRFNGGTYRDIFQNVISLVETKQSHYVCFVNVHMTVEALRDTYLMKVLSNSALNCYDGVPLLTANRLINRSTWVNERVSGMDMLPHLIEFAASSDKSVFFYGSTHEVLANVKSFLATNYPNLKDIKFYSPPFKELSVSEKVEIIELINDANPDMLFISLGCPKQEKWMFEMKNKIRCTMFGVGNAFRTLSGMEERAPRWMQKLALEWLFRLILEPRRLWKRYLISNTFFLLYFLKEFIKRNTVPFSTSLLLGFLNVLKY